VVRIFAGMCPIFSVDPAQNTAAADTLSMMPIHVASMRRYSFTARSRRATYVYGSCVLT